MTLAEEVFKKNRDRSRLPDYANINLLAACNATCFFCLGKDLGAEIDGRNDTSIHYSKWPNWEEFLKRCNDLGVHKLYLTGQNTDALLYKYLDELVDFVHDKGFSIGLRTNGKLALKKIDTINKCELSCGYSIHSLTSETNKVMMGWPFVLDWDKILTATQRPRVATVLSTHNMHEFFNIVDLVAKYPNVRYMQARRISTDDRQEEMLPHALAYEDFHNKIEKEYPLVKHFFNAPVYNIHGVEVTFWRTVKTDIESLNFFTDGTISQMYFIVEGYRLNKNKR